MIYQRSGNQEARYHRGQGLRLFKFERIKLPNNVPTSRVSLSSRASRRSRRSRSATPSVVTLKEDDGENGDEEPEEEEALLIPNPPPKSLQRPSTKLSEGPWMQ